MKNRLLTLSIVGNCALVIALLWSRTTQQDRYDELARLAMQADEVHAALHEATIAALEGADPEAREEVLAALRPLVDAARQNIEARDAAGIDR